MKYTDLQLNMEGKHDFEMHDIEEEIKAYETVENI